MKHSNDTIGDRTRNFPACKTVPQPTAPLGPPQIPQEMASDRTPVSTAADQPLLAKNAKTVVFLQVC